MQEKGAEKPTYQLARDLDQLSELLQVRYEPELQYFQVLFSPHAG
jgi:hypothetical protein